jgi:hypothetical protein
MPETPEGFKSRRGHFKIVHKWISREGKDNKPFNDGKTDNALTLDKTKFFC